MLAFLLACDTDWVRGKTHATQIKLETDVADRVGVVCVCALSV